MLTKSKGRFLTFLLTLLISCSAYGQEETLFPSASNISVLKATSGDVNLYSGKVDVSIPIYTVKEGGLSVNIALKYIGGSGIKVQEKAGEAGLGWAMMGAGIITRTTDNRPTDNPNTEIIKSTDSLDFIEGLKSHRGSKNLDVFNSSVGGRIIFDETNTPHFINEQGFKIEENGIKSPDRRWIIVSPKGDKYFFGETDASRERFVEKIVTVQGVFKRPSNVPNAWYLNKIISAKGETIQFEYEKSGSLVQYKYWNILRSKKTTSTTWEDDIKESISENEEIHLSRIVSSQSNVRFSYKSREDVTNGKAIADITVSSNSNTLITKFIFETDYFKSDDPIPARRLKLNALRQQTVIGESHLVASFEYNETENLPFANSTKFDYWGYYNNNNTGKYFVSDGANHTADLSKCKANILTGIRWPTGGSTQYTYELNSFRRNNIDHSGGGLRINSIKEMDGVKVLNTRSYNYSIVSSTGQQLSSGLIHQWFDITKGYVANYAIGAINRNLYAITKENALPVQKVIDLDGITIGYSKVILTHSDQSKEEFNFQDYADFPDQVKFYTFTGEPFSSVVKDVVLINKFEDYNGFNNGTSNSLQRGLISKRIIRNSKNDILKTIEYKYNAITGRVIAGLDKQSIGYFDGHGIAPSEDYYLVSLYSERVMSVRPVEIKEESFYPGSTTVHTTTTTNEYKGFPQPFLLTKQTQKQSDGSVLTTSNVYPSDMVALGRDLTGVYASMVTSNMIAPVIEKVDRVNNVQTVLTRTNYSPFSSSTGSLILPKSLEIQNNSSPIETRLLFNSYTAKGNAIETKAPNGLSAVTLWGYGGQYPIAEIKNATYAQVSNVLGQTVLNGLEAISVTEDAIESAISTLRVGLPQAYIISYTYIPTIGMASKTDERGRAEYYDYDGFGRLSAVRDDQGHILNTYCYNYKNELIDCNAVPLRNINDRIGEIEGMVSVALRLSGGVGENLSWISVKNRLTGAEVSRADFPDHRLVTRYLHLPEKSVLDGSLMLTFFSGKYAPMTAQERPPVNYQYQLNSDGPIWRISNGGSTNLSKYLEVPVSDMGLIPGQPNTLTMDVEKSVVIVPPAEFYMGSNFIHEGSDFSESGGRVSGWLTFQSPAPFSDNAADFVYVGGFNDYNLNPSATRQFYSGSWLCEVRNGASPRLYIKWIGSGPSPWGTGSTISINVNYTK